MKVQNWTSFSLDCECWTLSKSLTLSYLPDKPSTSLILFFSITCPIASSRTTHPYPNLEHDGSHRAHGFWYINCIYQNGHGQDGLQNQSQEWYAKTQPYPNDIQDLSPKILHCMTKEVIGLRILSWGHDPGVSMWALNTMEYLLIKEQQREIWGQRGEDDVTMK